MITRQQFEIVIDRVEAILLANGYRWIGDQQEDQAGRWAFYHFIKFGDWLSVSQALNDIADSNDLMIDASSMIEPDIDDALRHISIIANNLIDVEMIDASLIDD